MTRAELIGFIKRKYGANLEFLWERAPENGVFRHAEYNKWFAVVMRVDASKLGLNEDVRLEILNVKSDPNLISSLLKQKGFFKAYQMNKENWISISVKDVDDAQTAHLIDMSFKLTAKKDKGAQLNN